MSNDFYCDEVLNGKTSVKIVHETDGVLAYYHTRPFWPVHIVVIPKRHVSSLLTLEEGDTPLLLELLTVVRQVAEQVVVEHVELSDLLWCTWEVHSYLYKTGEEELGGSSGVSRVGNRAPFC